ncbi:MAG: hypothetical protein EPN60_18245 [Nevskiaceae bacterium]|jgi:hypothetical protein|nr:MAG: hypothetical protein EPO48_01940 [Nevskiaceae bacterium]TAM21550.1 MAG: hypothetical protein EPN60_18245 [Nevskiaceae bacterium]
MSRLWLALLLALCAWQAGQWWRLRPVQQANGVLVAEDPRQQPVEIDGFNYRDYRLSPRASYHLRARLLSRESYRLGREAELSPLDFALGWGVMSDNRVLDALEISQSGRYFWLRWGEAAPASETEMLRHAANTHLIPADDSVRRALARMRPGQVVALDGWLVDVAAKDGWQWQSSLTRSDTGAGACELLWVRSASVLLRGK